MTAQAPFVGSVQPHRPRLSARATGAPDDDAPGPGAYLLPFHTSSLGRQPVGGRARAPAFSIPQSAKDAHLRMACVTAFAGISTAAHGASDASTGTKFSPRPPNGGSPPQCGGNGPRGPNSPPSVPLMRDLRLRVSPRVWRATRARIVREHREVFGMRPWQPTADDHARAVTADTWVGYAAVNKRRPETARCASPSDTQQPQQLDGALHAASSTRPLTTTTTTNTSTSARRRKFSLPPCTAPPLVTQRSPRCVFGTSTRDHLPPATLKGQYVTVEATFN